ncbi:type II toxin-antitoxin system RelE/ParE family toxin [Bradyrhizobium sp.]|uniref:type II toxin-antitoxin system RelE/ParE family toxin n=1 Tax=Bradyrhizobium sp. TaxID=376 RepID=UPI003C434CA2
MLPRGSASPRAAMAEFRLTDRARADLIDIYEFTDRKFGSYQADAYYAGLVRTCIRLSTFPLSVTPDLLHRPA